MHNVNCDAPQQQPHTVGRTAMGGLVSETGSTVSRARSSREYASAVERAANDVNCMLWLCSVLCALCSVLCALCSVLCALPCAVLPLCSLTVWYRQLVLRNNGPFLSAFPMFVPSLSW